MRAAELPIGARSALVLASVLASLLALFIVASALGVSVFEDPELLLASGGPEAAVLGVALLIGDALLPVPASVVMISLGTLYGPVCGVVLSFVGRVAMGIAGFALGRRGGWLLERAIPAERERDYAKRLVERWGAVAIIVSRPVPLLAETTMLVAGAAGLRWRVAIAAVVIGAVPEAVAYGLLGAYAASAGNGALVWLGFLVVAATFRIVERRRASTTTSRFEPATSGS